MRFVTFGSREEPALVWVDTLEHGGVTINVRYKGIDQPLCRINDDGTLARYVLHRSLAQEAGFKLDDHGYILEVTP